VFCCFLFLPPTCTPNLWCELKMPEEYHFIIIPSNYYTFNWMNSPPCSTPSPFIFCHFPVLPLTFPPWQFCSPQVLWTSIVDYVSQKSYHFIIILSTEWNTIICSWSAYFLCILH
jgi:hypothetical protein